MFLFAQQSQMRMLDLLCGGCAVIHDFRLPLFDLFVFDISKWHEKTTENFFFCLIKWIHAWLHVSSLLYSTSGQMYLLNMCFNEIEGEMKFFLLIYFYIFQVPRLTATEKRQYSVQDL